MRGDGQPHKKRKGMSEAAAGAAWLLIKHLVLPPRRSHLTFGYISHCLAAGHQSTGLSTLNCV